MTSLSNINRAIIASGIMGILVSTYALYVELKAEGNPGYKAMCDISEKASCTRVLTSKFAKGFGVVDTSLPNPVIGILHYCIMIFLATFDGPLMVKMQFLISLIAVSSSVYLASLLIFVLKDICIVCISTYFINGLVVYLVFRKMKAVASKDK